MSNTQALSSHKVLLGSRIGYIEPAVRLVVGFFLLVITAGFFLFPKLNSLWLGLSIFVFIGLIGSGLTQFCIMAWTLRHMGFRSEWDELKKLERAHTEEKTRAGFLDTLNLLNEVIVEMSTDGELTWTSDKWSELFGKDAGITPSGGSLNFRRCVSGEYLEKFDQMVDFLRNNPEKQSNINFLVCGNDTDGRWVEGNFTLSRDVENRERLRGVLRDITKSHEEQLAIAHKATHDGLTGLPNRALLENRIKQEIGRARRTTKKFALFFIDLDKFKQVNDTAGHHVGDEVLKHVAAALSSCLRPSDTIARWGGDEFVALVLDLEDTASASSVAETLHDSAQNKLKGTLAETITFSIGVAVYPDDADSIGDLIIKADHALYSAKSNGRNNIQRNQAS